MADRSEDALIALRQIQRRTEIASRELAQAAGLTPSQLVVMHILADRGETSAGKLSEITRLSQATITSLVDKLEAKAFVSRRRTDPDRRRVLLTLLPDGEAALASLPDPLQTGFSKQFGALPGWQQAMLVAALEQIASLLDAQAIDAAPLLDIGPPDQRPQ